MESVTEAALLTDLLRGRIYRAYLAHIGEEKSFLVVSNNVPGT